MTVVALTGSASVGALASVALVLLVASTAWYFGWRLCPCRRCRGRAPDSAVEEAQPPSAQ